MFHPICFLRHKFLGIRDCRRNKHVNTHLAVIRQEQVSILNLLHYKVYAKRLGKTQHLDRYRDIHSSPVYIPKIHCLMKMTGYIILQLSISNRQLHNIIVYLTVAEVSSLRLTKFFTNQDFFFKNKSINLPIMLSDFGQGSSKIVP